mgnify:CR=1 FL=1
MKTLFIAKKFGFCLTISPESDAENETIASFSEDHLHIETMYEMRFFIKEGLVQRDAGPNKVLVLSYEFTERT